MEPASEVPKQEVIGPSTDERVQKLLETGFTRLGNSDIFELGEFTLGLKPDRNYSFYSPLMRPRDFSGSIRSIDKTTKIALGKSPYTDSPYLFAWGLNAEGQEEMTLNDEPFSGSSGLPPKDTPDPNSLEGRDLRQQLIDAGFQEDPNTEGLFQRRFGQENNDKMSVNVFAVLQEGKLVKLMKEIKSVYGNIENVAKLGPYTINGISEVERRFAAEKEDVLLAENERMSFKLTSSGYAFDFEFKKELTPDELGITHHEITEPSGFVVGGTNDSDLIRGLKIINNEPVGLLEQRMRPGKSSMAGFLGQDEKLIDVMVEDNDYVRSQGLTHKELGEQLRYAEAVYRQFGINEYQYKGRNFRVGVTQWRGIQDSPFKDGTGASADMEITNLDTGSSLRASMLMGHMIERYGFYEGHGTPYRVDPEKIIEVFDYLKQNQHNDQKSQS